MCPRAWGWDKFDEINTGKATLKIVVRSLSRTRYGCMSTRCSIAVFMIKFSELKNKKFRKSSGFIWVYEIFFVTLHCGISSLTLIHRLQQEGRVS